MTERLKIIFMGTPAFAATALKAIVDADNHDVICVYSQPPRPKGRGHAVQKSDVHILADTYGIDVRTPTSLKDKDAQDAFADLKADVAVVAAYGLLLPKVILEAPRHGCLNIHASLLPRWRGASPIQHAIWKGDEETGVTIMQMEEGLDTGPMIAKTSCPITAETKTSSLHDTLADMGSVLILDVLKTLAEKKSLTAQTQDDGKSTYAPLLKKEDGKIDWTQSATEIDRHIRALNPWPGTYTLLNDSSFKIKEAQLSGDTSNEQPGTLLNKAGHVACSDGVLQILSLQPPNKKPMDVQAAINGGYLDIGKRFS